MQTEFTAIATTVNPFAVFMGSDVSILAHQRLGGSDLARKVYRPLDKPLIGIRIDESAAAHDALMDGAEEDAIELDA